MLHQTVVPVDQVVEEAMAAVEQEHQDKEILEA
jgi:hypothetical protein